MNKNRNIIIAMISLVVVTAVVSFSVSALVFTGWSHFKPNSIYFDPGTVSAESIKKFDKVRSILKSEYYEKVDESKMLEGAIAGMADSLGDPYTAYYTREQWQAFEEGIAGSYVGIGISIAVDTDGLITVIEPFEGSPAEKAGMIKGDKIVKVNDEDVRRIKEEDIVVKKIKGQENTQVKITVYRPSEGKMIDFEVMRKRIKIENIKSKLLSGNIGYIRIVKFDGEIAKYFNEHLNKLVDKDIKGLIIDVRDDPGGYYDQVVAIADRLLPKGIIVYTEDKYKKRDIKRSDAAALDIPMVVLVNGNSASASEILAGALKDNNKGTLIGTKTFGKGLVQASSTLEDGSGIKLTVARYFTPSGVCIQGKGIEPDILVDEPEEYKNTSISDIPMEKDPQLQAAIENLKGKIK